MTKSIAELNIIKYNDRKHINVTFLDALASFELEMMVKGSHQSPQDQRFRQIIRPSDRQTDKLTNIPTDLKYVIKFMIMRHRIHPSIY